MFKYAVNIRKLVSKFKLCKKKEEYTKTPDGWYIMKKRFKMIEVNFGCGDT